MFSEIAVFFSKIAVVTFGGGYAVVAYVAQQAVDQFGWLQPGEMLDGLGMAGTTPGPLIMVTKFVGFMGASRQATGLHPDACRHPRRHCHDVGAIRALFLVRGPRRAARLRCAGVGERELSGAASRDSREHLVFRFQVNPMWVLAACALAGAAAWTIGLPGAG